MSNPPERIIANHQNKSLRPRSYVLPPSFEGESQAGDKIDDGTEIPNFPQNKLIYRRSSQILHLKVEFTRYKWTLVRYEMCVKVWRHVLVLRDDLILIKKWRSLGDMTSNRRQVKVTNVVVVSGGRAGRIMSPWREPGLGCIWCCAYTQICEISNSFLIFLWVDETSGEKDVGRLGLWKEPSTSILVCLNFLQVFGKKALLPWSSTLSNMN